MRVLNRTGRVCPEGDSMEIIIYFFSWKLREAVKCTFWPKHQTITMNFNSGVKSRPMCD